MESERIPAPDDDSLVHHFAPRGKVRILAAEDQPVPGTAAGLAILLLAPMPGLNAQAHTLAAIIGWVVVWWIGEPVPIPISAILGAVLCILAGVGDARTVLAPFAEPTIFLFLGSFILARAMSVHGLDRRFAYGIMSMGWIRDRSWRILFAYGAITAFISMWISNTATTAMMLPIGIGIVTAMAGMLEKKTGRAIEPARLRFATAMMLMAAYASSAGGIGTPVGTPPNLIGIAMIEKFAGVKIPFFQWMLFAVPMLLVMYGLLFLLLYFLHKPEMPVMEGSREFVRQELARLGPWNRGQKNSLIAFLVTVCLWVIPGFLAIFWGSSAGDHQVVRPQAARGGGRPDRRLAAFRAAAGLEKKKVHHHLAAGRGHRLGHPAAVRRRPEPGQPDVLDRAGRAYRPGAAAPVRGGIDVGHYLCRGIHRHRRQRDHFQHRRRQHGGARGHFAGPGRQGQPGASGPGRDPGLQLGIHAAGVDPAERHCLWLRPGADRQNDPGRVPVRPGGRIGHLGRVAAAAAPDWPGLILRAIMPISGDEMNCARKFFSAGLLLLAAATLPAQEIKFPLIQALAWIPPGEGNLLPAGSRAWQVDLSDANIFSFSRDLQIINDLSVFSVYLTYRRGISAAFTFEVSGGLRVNFDSGMDQFIKKVDAALGFSDSGRDVFPERTIHYKFRDHFYHTRNNWLPAPLVLGLTGKVFRMGNLALNGRVNIGIPLSDQPGFSSKKVFALAGLMFEYAQGSLAVSGAAAMAFFNAPAWLANEQLGHSYFEARLKIRLSRFILGAIFRTSPFAYEENSNNGKVIYIGYLIKKRFEIGFMEDIPPMDTVPDFAFYLKVHLNRLQP